LEVRTKFAATFLKETTQSGDFDAKILGYFFPAFASKSGESDRAKIGIGSISNMVLPKNIIRVVFDILLGLFE
jgi:hypothetical protein